MNNNEEIKIATSTSWKCIPFPTSKKIECNIVLTNEEFNKVSKGHIPFSMEDHWFMYCDENSINYFRSWTGKQIYKGYYKIEDDSCIIYQLEINDNINDTNQAIKDFNDLLKDHCKYCR